jgi:mycothiol synthase
VLSMRLNGATQSNSALRDPRAYTSTDLPGLEALQSAFKRHSPASGYHPGDLNWWFYYGDADKDLSQYVTVWEDAAGGVAAWAFCTYEARSADVGIHPRLRGTAAEIAILNWVETALTETQRAAPDQTTVTIIADDDEAARMAYLSSRGFRPEDVFVLFVQDIRAPISTPTLPEGFYFLDRMDAAHADLRADVHFQAFSPNSKMTGDRYRHFMTAPRYDPVLDTVVVAPDDRFAAYAMGWNDAVSRVSTFEPVGTRPEFQRRGLGRAALLEGMRRMQARGMETATVVANASSAGNIVFYQSAGFVIANRIRAYKKPISGLLRKE